MQKHELNPRVNRVRRIPILKKRIRSIEKKALKSGDGRAWVIRSLNRLNNYKMELVGILKK